MVAVVVDLITVTTAAGMASGPPRVHLHDALAAEGYRPCELADAHPIIVHSTPL
jgi:hypothetical protein